MKVCQDGAGWSSLFHCVPSLFLSAYTSLCTVTPIPALGGVDFSCPARVRGGSNLVPGHLPRFLGAPLMWGKDSHQPGLGPCGVLEAGGSASSWHLQPALQTSLPSCADCPGWGGHSSLGHKEQGPVPTPSLEGPWVTPSSSSKAAWDWEATRDPPSQLQHHPLPAGHPVSPAALGVAWTVHRSRVFFFFSFGHATWDAGS